MLLLLRLNPTARSARAACSAPVENSEVDLGRARAPHPLLGRRGSPDAASMQWASNIAFVERGQGLIGDQPPAHQRQGILCSSGRVYAISSVKLRDTTDARSPRARAVPSLAGTAGSATSKPPSPALDGRGPYPSGVQGRNVVLVGQAREERCQQDGGERRADGTGIARPPGPEEGCPQDGFAGLRSRTRPGSAPPVGTCPAHRATGRPCRPGPNRTPAARAPHVCAHWTAPGPTDR